MLKLTHIGDNALKLTHMDTVILYKFNVSLMSLTKLPRKIYK